MANVLPREKQIAVISALVEGASIRSIDRMTGVNRETVGTLLVRVGEGCAAYNYVRQHKTLRCSPAMAAGLEATLWSIGDLLDAADAARGAS